MAENSKNTMMATNATLERKRNPAELQRPVTGKPAPDSDIFFFINGAFRHEFEVCAQLSSDRDVVTFEADLVKKLNQAETIPYATTLRVPKGCMMRAKMHPIFRRMLVQSMWLQQQPAMLRYKGQGQKIEATSPVCTCANPPCENSAVRFVGNPGFFLQKNMLIDPFCIPVCLDAACVMQAQQMSNTIHAQAQQQAQQQAASVASQGKSANPFAIDVNNPALKAQIPNSVKTCNSCGSFERTYGGTALVLKACPLCGIAYYCSQQCQVGDWQRGHKDVCTNAQGKGESAAKLAHAAARAQQRKALTTTIPEDGSGQASAPAPAPAPIPLQMPVPAPAPMPLRTVQSSAKPAPPTKKTPSPSEIPQQNKNDHPGSKDSSMANLTQAMATMAAPTYKMPEPEVSLSVGAGYAMPEYKMPEPEVPQTTPPAYTVPAFNAPAFNGIEAPAATTPATTTSSGAPQLAVQKTGRKKAE